MRRTLHAACVTAVLACAAAATAQGLSRPIFDRFNLRLEASAVTLATTIRLDSSTLERGTTLSFEDDFGLDDRTWTPTLSFEWQVKPRQRLAARWQDVPRGSTTQALREIEWGDETIPIDSEVKLDFVVEQIFVDYTYFPWMREEWAGGFGLGLRWMDLKTILEVDKLELEDQLDVAAPLPYVYFEYLRMLGERWRLRGGGGWLSVTIGDINGGQWIGRLGVEYLTGRSWGFGAALNASAINVDWSGIENHDGDNELRARVDLDIHDLSVYIRFRFGD